LASFGHRRTFDESSHSNVSLQVFGQGKSVRERGDGELRLGVPRPVHIV
jgi:hypothetical protein